MIKNKHPGKFIVFDSLDGSGQSTQTSLLYDWLDLPSQKRLFGHTGVHVTKEPTTGLIGGLIKGQLTHDWKSSPECLQLLFSADRAHHLEKEIIPLLERGVIVVCDRYLFSTLAYGQTEINDFKWLLNLQKYFLLPDLTIFLKVSPKACMARIEKSRYEITLFEKEKVLTAVWKNYVKLTKQISNIHVVNGERPVEKIAQEIQMIVKKSLG